MPLPDQIDEAIRYIKSLEMKIKESKEKKEILIGNKKRPLCSDIDIDISSSSKSPEIQIREMGSTLEIVLTTGLENKSMFCDVIRVLQQEAAEVVSANCSVVGDAVFYVVHAEVGVDFVFCFGGFDGWLINGYVMFVV